jgi:hypothetical protein
MVCSNKRSVELNKCRVHLFPCDNVIITTIIGLFIATIGLLIPPLKIKFMGEMLKST